MCYSLSYTIQVQMQIYFKVILIAISNCKLLILENTSMCFSWNSNSKWKSIKCGYGKLCRLNSFLKIKVWVCENYKIVKNNTKNSNSQGQDSPSLKLFYLSLWLSFFQWKNLLEEKNVIVELGKSQPRNLEILSGKKVYIAELFALN